MKIRIEVELSADEAPKAAQLLDVLRQISDHVSVSTQPRSQAQVYSSAQTQGQGQGQGGNSSSSGAAAAAGALPTPIRMSAPAPSSSSQAGPTSNITLDGLILSATSNAQEARFVQILMGLRDPDPSLVSQIGREVIRVFAGVQNEPGSGAEELATAIKDFFNAFYLFVFEPEKLGRSPEASLPVATYVSLISSLPKQFTSSERQKGPINEYLVPRMLKFLTVRHPITGDRAKFFPYAEAFAALVKAELVAVTGAVSLLVTLLSRTDYRLAAVTMLGKTVELCHMLLLEKCDGDQLATLDNALATHVTEETFMYDVQYVREHLFVSEDRDGDGGAGGSQHGGRGGDYDGSGGVRESQGQAMVMAKPALHPPVSFEPRHGGTIFALAVDAEKNQLISSGKDGNLMVWDGLGMCKERIPLRRYYACSMDITVANKGTSTTSLFICGVARNDKSISDPATCPSIMMYNRPSGAVGPSIGWSSVGVVEKPDARLISTVKCISVGPGPELFVSGECMNDDRQMVAVYDAHAGSFSTLAPIQVHTEHTQIITCLSNYPGSDTFFFSGSRDSTVRLWDRRMQASAHTLTGHHNGMITCLDAAGHILVSAGIDKQVVAWDMRKLKDDDPIPMSKRSVDDKAILKVSLGPAPTKLAAVSTLRGLYIVDLLNAADAAEMVPSPSEGASVRYHDLKWSSDMSRLFAGGDGGYVDCYTVNRRQ